VCAASPHRHIPQNGVFAYSARVSIPWGETILEAFAMALYIAPVWCSTPQEYTTSNVPRVAGSRSNTLTFLHSQPPFGACADSVRRVVSTLFGSRSTASSRLQPRRTAASE